MNERVRSGLVWGLAGTLAMTVLMLLATVTGVSPLPMPVPLALSRLVLGAQPVPLLAAVGMAAHFAYGAVAGAVFAVVLAALRPGTQAPVLWGLAFGALLWLGMQLVVLPVLGWGLFGAQVTPAIAVGTLVLHLVYGGVLGLGVRRRWAHMVPATA